MPDWFHALAEMLSLALTVAGLIWAAEVMRFWGPEARRAAFAKHRTASQWLILGIVVSFAGSVVDNVYWGIAWFSNFLQLEAAKAWFHNGVYSNVPFRQIPLLAASALHAYGAVVHTENETHKGKEFRRFKRMAAASLGAGLITLLILIAVKLLA